MASTSCRRLAEELLERCLAGEPGEVDPRLTSECSAELFRVVAEGLADRFDPQLSDLYDRLFSRLLGVPPPVRVVPPVPFNVERVFVLSRVTLGADVAVTSTILDAAKRRFPEARILLAGSRKSWELFAADSRVEHVEIDYPRVGTLAERLAVWPRLRKQLSVPASIVIDPDSRLTQLGLLPVCDPNRNFHFPSRSYGGDSDESLVTLTRRWVREVFGVDASPYFAPMASSLSAKLTLSFGVGENPAKRIPDPFERELVRALAARGFDILVDKGAGDEESERVERAVAGVPRVRTWQGAFAPFAGAIARSRFYIGYDSAGQHVAAACGVPLVSVFAGFPTLRMFHRWRPTGRGPIEVVRVDSPDPARALAATMQALDRLGVS